MKYKWKVKERNGYGRLWPMAYYVDGRIAAMIACDRDYTPVLAKVGTNLSLKVRVADHRVYPFVWRTMTRSFSTLKEAKEALKSLLDKRDFLGEPLVEGRWHIKALDKEGKFISENTSIHVEDTIKMFRENLNVDQIKLVRLS